MNQSPAMQPFFTSRCLKNRPVTRKALTTVIAASVCIGLLSGCSTASGAAVGQAKAVSQGEADASTSDPKPTAEGSAVPPGGPGFVDDSTGAPVVQRDDEKPAGDKADAVAGGFESAPAKYSDGVLVSVGGLRSGVVTTTDPGSIAGAPYVQMEVKIENGSSRVLAVSNVVITLRHGDGTTAAAPLYDGLNQLDFAGDIKTGESQVRGYAFMVPEGTDVGTIFVDIDGAHTPAVLSGKLPK